MTKIRVKCLERVPDNHVKVRVLRLTEDGWKAERQRRIHNINGKLYWVRWL